MITEGEPRGGSFLAGLLGRRPEPAWVREEVLSFKSWLQGLGYSPHTVRAYGRDLLDFLLADAPPEEFLASLRLGPHSLHRKAAAIRAWARWRGLELRVPRVRLPRALPRALSEEEARRVEEEAQLHPDPRVFPAVLLMSRAGLRRSEVCGLRLRDVDLRGGVIHVRGAKGRRDRTVPIPRGLKRPLEVLVRLYRYRRLPPDTPLLGFSPQTLYRQVRELGRRAGLGNLHPHALRHTAATRMLRRGMSTPGVARVLGHRDLNTTQRYLRLTIEDLKREMEGTGL